MYTIKNKSQAMFQRIRGKYYSECIGITQPYVYNILKGFKCAEICARAIISVYFNVSFDDKQKIDELLEEHFDKLED